MKKRHLRSRISSKLIPGINLYLLYVERTVHKTTYLALGTSYIRITGIIYYIYINISIHHFYFPAQLVEGSTLSGLLGKP